MDAGMLSRRRHFRSLNSSPVRIPESRSEPSLLRSSATSRISAIPVMGPPGDLSDGAGHARVVAAMRSPVACAYRAADRPPGHTCQGHLAEQASRVEVGQGATGSRPATMW
jgi:hypothetical protein